jgi:hypothetical protein
VPSYCALRDRDHAVATGTSLCSARGMMVCVGIEKHE